MAKTKLGIVSTTINDETGYLAFDALAARSDFEDVFFCIAADRKTPSFDTACFECPIIYLTPDEQKLYRCSPEIGWNKIMRRNVALLRCIAEQPDFILMVDDDNIPPDNYFERWKHLLLQDANRQVVASTLHEIPWHNYLKSANAPVEIYPRGFPVQERGKHETEITSLTGRPIQPKDIWLYQGISLGDPDIDAMTRITIQPELTRVSDFNYVMRDVWTPCNTQNTLFSRELFPLAFVWPHCGRFDDICASFTWQHFTFSQSRYIHIGEPFNHQRRRSRAILEDLSAEVDGYLYCLDVVDSIQSIVADTAIQYLDALLDLTGPEIVLKQQRFMEAFRRDLEGVLH